MPRNYSVGFKEKAIHPIIAMIRLGLLIAPRLNAGR